MSKSIKVSDEVYHRLMGMLTVRETFSQVIERLLEVYYKIESVSSTLGASHYLKRERDGTEVGKSRTH